MMAPNDHTQRLQPPKRRIDFHCHAFPEPALAQTLKFAGAVLGEKVPPLRYGAAQLQWYAREISNRAATHVHHLQTFIRHIPEPLRNPVDEATALYPLAHLLIESTLTQLGESLTQNQLDYAVLIAHPPYIPNDFVIEAAQSDPRLIPAVNIAPNTADPGAELRRLIEAGAKLLKIHASADGVGIDSPHYAKLLECAREAQLPVILHTGCIHSRLLNKEAPLGDARLFEPWFKKYGDLQFVLAHMNYHEPHTALDLARTYTNVWVDTSWQPSEMIGEAVRQLGSRRVLYATDWPFIGDNQRVGMKRIDEAVASGDLTEGQADDIRGNNAARLLKLDVTSFPDGRE